MMFFLDNIIYRENMLYNLTLFLLNNKDLKFDYILLSYIYNIYVFNNIKK